MQHAVYICHSTGDAQMARDLTARLEQSGLICWLAVRDALPGQSWGQAITEAIRVSKAAIVIVSSHSNTSRRVRGEIEFAVSKKIPIIPYLVEDVELTEPMQSLLGSLQKFDARGPNIAAHATGVVQALHGMLPAGIIASDQTAPPKKAADKSRGYVFISYVRGDSDFVERLRGALERKGYGYWDYAVGNRDYHGILYRELEERIDGAVAFMTVVSDKWRNSDWVASEFIYAKEAKIPIFAIEAKKLQKPLPILLNLQTRINMAEDFDNGAMILAEELAKKGL